MNALEGILVVALEQAVAVPTATCKLADAGARVIKLERAEGDFARGYDDYAKGQSSYFVWLNRGKESCRVDLKQEDDRAMVEAMLAQADVFIQNLAPGATGRLGLGAADLRARYPRLITCDVSGYAPGTPHHTRKAYDLLVQAESGLAAITGTQASGPSRIGVSIADIATGQAAYAAILEALLRRAKTGEGSAIQLSLFDTLGDLMNVPYLTRRYGGIEPPRLGLAHPSIAPYGVFSTADGDVLISIQASANGRSSPARFWAARLSPRTHASPPMSCGCGSARRWIARFRPCSRRAPSPRSPPRSIAMPSPMAPSPASATSSHTPPRPPWPPRRRRAPSRSSPRPPSSTGSA